MTMTSATATTTMASSSAAAPSDAAADPAAAAAVAAADADAPDEATDAATTADSTADGSAGSTDAAAASTTASSSTLVNPTAAVADPTALCLDDETLLLNLKCISVLSKSFLSEKQFRRLIERLEYRTYAPGERIVTLHQPTPAALYLVVSGKSWLQREESKSPAMLPAACTFGEEMLAAAEVVSAAGAGTVETEASTAEATTETAEASLDVPAPYSVWGHRTEGCRCAVLTMKACREVFDIDRAEKQRDAAVSNFGRMVVREPKPSRPASSSMQYVDDSSDESSSEDEEEKAAAAKKKKEEAEKAKKKKKKEHKEHHKEHKGHKEKDKGKKKKVSDKPPPLNDHNGDSASNLSVEEYSHKEPNERDDGEEKASVPEEEKPAVAVPVVVAAVATPPSPAAAAKPVAAVEREPVPVSSARSRFENQILENEKASARAWHSPMKSPRPKVAIPSSPRSPAPVPAPAGSPKAPPVLPMSPEGDTKTLETEGSSGADEEEDMVKLAVPSEPEPEPEPPMSPVQIARNRFEAKTQQNHNINNIYKEHNHSPSHSPVKSPGSHNHNQHNSPHHQFEKARDKLAALPLISESFQSPTAARPPKSPTKSKSKPKHGEDDGHKKSKSKPKHGEDDGHSKTKSKSRPKHGEDDDGHSKTKKKKKSKKPVSSSIQAARKKFDNFLGGGKSKSKKDKGSGKREEAVVPRPPRNVFQEKVKTPKDYKPPVHPKSKKDETTIRGAMDDRVLLKNLPERTVGSLTAAFEKSEVKAGMEIVKQGAVDDCYYVVSKGECEYEVDGVRLTNVPVKPGDSFGEEALVIRQARGASVWTKTDTEVYKVDQTTYRQLLESEVGKDDSRKRQLLDKIDFLQGVSSDNRQKLAGLMTPKKFRAGDTLVRKDDYGKAFFLIDEGEVECRDVHDRGGSNQKDFKVGPGGYLGEQTLVDVDDPIKADVVATKSGHAYVIDRAKYRSAVGTSCDLVPIESRTMLAIQALRRKEGTPLKDKDVLKLTDRIKDILYSAGETIIDESVETEAAIYFLRQGGAYSNKGEVGSLKGRIMTMLAVGTTFGEELFVEAKDAKRLTGMSPYRVSAKTDCVCGVLSIGDYYEVFGEKATKSKQAKESTSKSKHSKKHDKAVKESKPPKSPASPTKKAKAKAIPVAEAAPVEEAPSWPKVDVPLADLERLLCLGEGNFGQVWLVVDKTVKDPDPYVLKIQSKYHLLSEGEAEVCIQEKHILTQMEHPFVVDLVSAYQDVAFVYMMLEFVQGGELFSVMNPYDRIKLPESQAKFYALAMADALRYMHSKKFVYRDLKPENVLIDSMGYPKLIDFGFAKKVTDKTFTLCGTPGYLAPEVVLNKGHNWSVDHWQLGVLIYEMVSLESPFFEEDIDQMELYRCVIEDDVPEMDDETGGEVSPEVWDLITGLLVKDPTDRYGSLARGERDILHHEWFKDVSLIKLKHRQLKAPWLPKVTDPMDTSNFDDWSDLEDVTLDKGPRLSEKQARQFDNF